MVVVLSMWVCECIFMNLLVTVITMFGKCTSSSTVVLYIH